MFDAIGEGVNGNYYSEEHFEAADGPDCRRRRRKKDGVGFCPDREYYHVRLFAPNENPELVTETEKAYLFKVADGEFWVPKKLCKCNLFVESMSEDPKLNPYKYYKVHCSFSRQYVGYKFFKTDVDDVKDKQEEVASMVTDPIRKELCMTERMSRIGAEVAAILYDEAVSRALDGTPADRKLSSGFPSCDDIIDLYANGSILSHEAIYLAMERVKEED